VAGSKFTRYGWSKYQVPVDLPDYCTDIREVIPPLNEAVRLYNEAATRTGEPLARSGAHLFFSWASDGHFEVSACWPTPHSDRQVLRLDPSEWRPEYFRFEGSRLHHLASGVTYYAVQVRVRRHPGSARGEEAADETPAAASAAPQPAEQKKGKIAALAELFCEVGREHSGSEDWKPNDFSAHVDRGDPRVTAVKRSGFYEACREAKRILRRERRL
jgi:hypothetical protein